MKMMAMRHTVAAIGLGGMLAALATLLTAEAANAAGYSQRHQAAPIAYNAQENPNYGFGPRVRVQPNDVVSGERIVGRDPDPFIRGESCVTTTTVGRSSALSTMASTYRQCGAFFWPI